MAGLLVFCLFMIGCSNPSGGGEDPITIPVDFEKLSGNTYTVAESFNSVEPELSQDGYWITTTPKFGEYSPLYADRYGEYEDVFETKYGVMVDKEIRYGENQVIKDTMYGTMVSTITKKGEMVPDSIVKYGKMITHVTRMGEYEQITAWQTEKDPLYARSSSQNYISWKDISSSSSGTDMDLVDSNNTKVGTVNLVRNTTLLSSSTRDVKVKVTLTGASSTFKLGNIKVYYVTTSTKPGTGTLPGASGQTLASTETLSSGSQSKDIDVGKGKTSDTAGYIYVGTSSLRYVTTQGPWYEKVGGTQPYSVPLEVPYWEEVPEWNIEGVTPPPEAEPKIFVEGEHWEEIEGGSVSWEIPIEPYWEWDPNITEEQYLGDTTGKIIAKEAAEGATVWIWVPGITEEEAINQELEPKIFPIVPSYWVHDPELTEKDYLKNPEVIVPMNYKIGSRWVEVPGAKDGMGYIAESVVIGQQWNEKPGGTVQKDFPLIPAVYVDPVYVGMPNPVQAREIVLDGENLGFVIMEYAENKLTVSIDFGVNEGYLDSVYAHAFNSLPNENDIENAGFEKVNNFTYEIAPYNDGDDIWLAFRYTFK